MSMVTVFEGGLKPSLRKDISGMSSLKLCSFFISISVFLTS